MQFWMVPSKCLVSVIQRDMLRQARGSKRMLYTEQHRELMRSVTKFIEAEINPHAEEWEQAGIFPAHELFRKMGQQGLLGIHKPEKFGGQGLDYSYQVAFCEALGAAKSASAVMAIGVQTDMATPALTQNGPEDRKSIRLKSRH